MISIEAIVFDFDGTLVDSSKDITQAVQFLQKKWGVRRSTEKEVASFIGDGVVRLVERSLPGVRGKSLKEAVAQFKHYYRLHCLDHTDLYPQVAETLHRFRHKKMAVVTNKPARISRYMVEALGLASCFRIVLGGDSTRLKKPHPEPVLFALRSMGVASPRSAVVVGDSSNDILAGRAAGAYTCGIFSNIGDCRRLRASGPDFEILKLNELMRIFN